ncbi:hypothetical protein [Nitrosococcus wardiae]|uniref:Phage P1-related protein n=1 Tax=Nitrosococcus wardiae TaxID=1814290 RepID=A0A4P7C5G3_9GAMM|nr:hypothetical protein [Nitrosococcus wardiae]QBQ56246.1 hypothetical protein E3U44_18370 [Nitrosococcus wardiae]
MIDPPALLPFQGDWAAYEDAVYEAFLASFVRAEVRFREVRVKAQYRPETRGKGYSFWHVISEAPHPGNRNEEDRIPDFNRCARIRWIAWAIEQASNGTEEGFSWWENRRGRETRVVIWAELWDFAVILSKRRDYYLLKTAYCDLKPHRRRSFEKERKEFLKL